MRKHLLTCQFYILVLAFAVSLCNSCTEPFASELLPEAESILVVDATLTNELKNHEVFLSRSSLERGDLQIEQNATIQILVNNQLMFTFTETVPGTYISDQIFQAVAGTEYQLQIVTSDKKTYSSKSVTLSQTSQIANVMAQKTLTDTGNEGILITVDSFDPTGNSTYYKYEYEETYKIIAPNWVPLQLVAGPEEFQSVGIVNRDPDKEEKTCYSTDKSNSIILTKTFGAGEDRVSDFQVRFLNRNNYIISHRYSILVKQFVLSQQAYTFYEKLQDFSGSESLFSQSQPGFINGNIFSDDTSNERVVGIFEVSSVSEKRAFFNYVDFFPNEDLPPYIDECKRTTIANGDPSIYEPVRSNQVSFVGEITNQATGGVEAYIIVPRVCGDCNVLGSNVAPDFWEE